MKLFSFFKRKKDKQTIKTSTDNNKEAGTNLSEPRNSSEQNHIDTQNDRINKNPSRVNEVSIIPKIITEEDIEEYDPTKNLSNYIFPYISLLDECKNININVEELQDVKKKIISILQLNGIDISSIKANQGYVNATYEVTPTNGFRMSKIKQLKTDLEFALLAPQLSVEPIIKNGKIQIIIPNKKFQVLPLLPIISSQEFQESDFKLPLIIGQTMNINNLIIDLIKQRHILIAGATGQGKSVLLNVMIMSLLYKKHPAELKLVLIDTSGLEFNRYSSLEKHYLAKVPNSENPIITDTSVAVKTIKSVCIEMNDRFQLLLSANAQNIQDYNKKFQKRLLTPLKGNRYLPYILIAIDEYFDLSTSAGLKIEEPLISLTRKGHIVGIHIILSSQRPTKNIITGSLKFNFSTRIAFNVTSSIDSKIIIDKNGAENLFGKGDCLYFDGLTTTRIQVPYISTKEIETIVEFIKDQQGYVSAFELPEDINNYSLGHIRNVDPNELDPLFEEAAKLVVIHQQGSTSLIQRKFSIGYNRSGRLVDQLEANGIIGPSKGSSPRDVLIANEYILKEKLASLKL